MVEQLLENSIETPFVFSIEKLNKWAAFSEQLPP